jgi:hypothetical protein
LESFRTCKSDYTVWTLAYLFENPHNLLGLAHILPANEPPTITAVANSRHHLFSRRDEYNAASQRDILQRYGAGPTNGRPYSAARRSMSRHIMLLSTDGLPGPLMDEGCRKSWLLLFTTPKLHAEQCSADRDSAWDPGSKQWGRCWMKSSSATLPSSPSNTPDNRQTQLQRKGGG